MIKKKKPDLNRYDYVVPSFYEGTISDYLKRYHRYSSRVITRVVKEGNLSRNGEDVFFKATCAPGDRLIVTFPGEFPDCEVSHVPIDILYEDEDIIVVNKGPDMVVHPTKSHQTDTLSNAVYGHWEETGHVGKMRFVNRIDRDTSGIVVGAKNKYVHHFIQSQFQEGGVKKHYYALSEGFPPRDSGRIDSPIGREEPMSIFREVREDGDPCVTLYEVLERFDNHCLLRLTLLTGRTHQIRVHLKSIGCPILGDSLYNPGENPYISRQALHAGEISFLHPRTGERVSFTAPLPEDIARALTLLRGQ